MNSKMVVRSCFGKARVPSLCIAIAILVQFSLFLVLAGTPAFSQTGAGTLSGTVRDQSGAVVVAAPVALTNTGTNVVLRSSSSQAGFYMFPDLVPGSYRLDIEAVGMKKYAATLSISVQQSAVVDITLQVGAATTEVSVTDVTPTVTVDSATLSEELDRGRIDQLPINGRNLTSLMAVVPGVMYQNQSGQDGGLRSYGQRFMAQDMTLDGASLTNSYWGDFVSARQPGMDSIQEVQVVNNNASAEFSRPMTIVLATKSGTNQLHGSAFEANRNSGWGVARQRQSTFTTPPFLNRNEFGVSAGGPVYIPKIYNGKNRTFWFVGYEGSRLINPTFAGASLPTQAMRGGDFSGLVNAQGQRYTIYNPWTTGANWSRQPFNYNGKLDAIDPSLQSPLSKYLTSITPLPTTQDNPLVANNWFGNWPYWTRSWTVSTRIDHQFSDKDRIYGTYSDRPYTYESHTWSFPTTNPVIGTFLNTAPSWSAGLNYLHVFSPSMSNTLTFSVNRERWAKGTGAGTYYEDQLGLPNALHQSGWFNIAATELSGDLYGGDASQGNFRATFILGDNAVKVIGKHELKFGFQGRYDQTNNLADQNTNTAMNPNTMATSLYDPSSSLTNPLALPYTGSAAANEYLGIMNYQLTQTQKWFYDRQHNYALYFQDNFRATARLTLNLGLRWEYYTPLREKYDQYNGFDQKNQAVILGSPLSVMEAFGNTTPALIAAEQAMGMKFESYQDAGWPKGLMTTDKKDFAPHLGFAYRTGDGARSVVARGGYVISYFPMNTRTYNQGASQNAPTDATYEWSVTDTTVAPDGIANYGMRSVPTVIAGLNSANAITLANPVGITPGSNATASRFVGQPEQFNGRVQNWNFTLEKEIAKETMVRITYQGSYSDHIIQNHSINDAMPSNVWYYSTGLPLVTGTLANVAARNYNMNGNPSSPYGTLWAFYATGYMNEGGMVFQIERRYHKGYAYQLFYTVTNAFADVGDQRNGTWIGGDNTIPDANQYLPGAVPLDDMQRDRLLNYKRDITFPKHEIRWNFMVDLPVGKGKALLGNASRVVNAIVGGWQVAGIGNMSSQWATLPTSIYPTGTELQVYGNKYKIQDCTSGVCYPAYLYFNGYVPSNLINSHNAAGQPNGYEGVPANYQPAASYLIPTGQTTLPANAPAGTNVSSYWNTNTTWVTLKNGTVQRTTTAALNPWMNQYILGPWLWNQDASLFKKFQIRERYSLRFNVDAFNIFNHPGNSSSVASTGLLSLRNSANPARVLQATLRLSW